MFVLRRANGEVDCARGWVREGDGRVGEVGLVEEEIRVCGEEGESYACQEERWWEGGGEVRKESETRSFVLSDCFWVCGFFISFTLRML